MPFVHSLTATPPPRYDGQPWTLARIQESADNVVFATVETQVLPSPDADPTSPVARRLTTALATIETGWMRVAFLDADGNESPPSSSVFVPGTGFDGYPSVGELIAASSVDELTSLDAAQKDALRASAIAAVEAWTAQAFVAEGTSAVPVTRTLSGTGADTLYLPKRLAELTALSVEGRSYLLADVTLSDERDHLGWVDPLVGGSWATRVRRHPGDPGPRWPLGRANVLVSGVWGWTDEDWASGVLAPVADAIRFDMEDQALADANALSSTIRSARSLGLSSIQQGGLSVALHQGEPGLSIRAQRKLLPFKWTVPVASAA